MISLRLEPARNVCILTLNPSQVGNRKHLWLVLDVSQNLFYSARFVVVEGRSAEAKNGGEERKLSIKLQI